MAITGPLISQPSTLLADYPGAPFPDSVITDVSEQIRSEARWHIAPQGSDTVLLDSDGSDTLVLPTLYLVEVTLVRDLSDPDNPSEITDYRVSRRVPMLKHTSGRWPSGLESVEVTMTHGYTDCPRDLLPVVAEMAQTSSVNRAVGQEQAGQQMVTFIDPSTRPKVSRTVRRYQLPRLA